MAVYSEAHHYIFFANPQTASKAIALTLREKLDGKALPERAVTRNGEIIARKHHTTYSQLVAAGLMSEQQLEGLFKFTCVRNPFDQLVSKYLKHCERLGNVPPRYPWLEGGIKSTAPDNSFPQWLVYLSKHFTETDKLARGPFEFLAHADLVIRFEALQAGFDEFLAHIGIQQPLPITEFNITKARADAAASASAAASTATPAAIKRKKNYAEYYDAGSIALVEWLYEPILTRFDYGFGEPARSAS